MKQFRFLVIVLVSIVLVGGGCTGRNTAVKTEGLVVENYGSEVNEGITPMEEVNEGTAPEKADEPFVKDESMEYIRIATEKGDILFELFPETAPKAVENFKTLTEKGFYDGLTFHRREEGFVIQGGDPNGNGTGGPGYKFEDELDDEHRYDRGTVAMANSGPNTNGSQFFIMLDDVPLPKLYTIFGRVVEGMDVVDQIEIGDKMSSLTVE